LEQKLDAVDWWGRRYEREFRLVVEPATVKKLKRSQQSMKPGKCEAVEDPEGYQRIMLGMNRGQWITHPLESEKADMGCIKQK
jgi:hypothetical protein